MSTKHSYYSAEQLYNDLIRMPLEWKTSHAIDGYWIVTFTGDGSTFTDVKSTDKWNLLRLNSKGSMVGALLVDLDALKKADTFNPAAAVVNSERFLMEPLESFQLHTNYGALSNTTLNPHPCFGDLVKEANEKKIRISTEFLSLLKGLSYKGGYVFQVESSWLQMADLVERYPILTRDHGITSCPLFEQIPSDQVNIYRCRVSDATLTKYFKGEPPKEDLMKKILEMEPILEADGRTVKQEPLYGGGKIVVRLLPDGSRDGPCVIYGNDGKKAILNTYKEGSKHGPYESYDETGAVTEHCVYENDTIHGIFERYHKGKLIYRSHNDHGIRVGLRETYENDGTPISRELYSKYGRVSCADFERTSVPNQYLVNKKYTVDRLSTGAFVLIPKSDGAYSEEEKGWARDLQFAMIA